MEDNEQLPAEQSGNSGFRLEQLFGSKTRARLLGLFLENPEKAYYVRDLARRVDAQLNAVRRELKNLLDLGIVKEGEGELAGETGEVEGVTSKELKRFYRADTSSVLFDDLRRLMKKASVLMNRSLIETLSDAGELQLVVLTGRFTEVLGVPTDLLIVGDLTANAVQLAVADFERDVGREINYTVMPRKEHQYRLDVGDRFLSGIMESRHVTLFDIEAKAPTA